MSSDAQADRRDGDRQRAGQRMRAPGDLGEARKRPTERFVFRNEKAACREPLPDHHSAEHGEADDGQHGVEGDPCHSAERRETGRRHSSSAPRRPPARPPPSPARLRIWSDTPARMRRRPLPIEDPDGPAGDATGPSMAVASRGLSGRSSAPRHQQRHRAEREPEEKRLGHRRRLQVQHVRIQRERRRRRLPTPRGNQSAGARSTR